MTNNLAPASLLQKVDVITFYKYYKNDNNDMHIHMYTGKLHTYNV